MDIYKTREFSRWARKQGLQDAALCQAVQEMINGLYEADLGSSLFKKRIARRGQGKSSGFRVLVATNRGNRWFFLYGFSKNERSNIDNTEEATLKKLAAVLLSMPLQGLSMAQDANELTKVKSDA